MSAKRKSQIGWSHISAWATVQSFYMCQPRQYFELARPFRMLGPWWYCSIWTGPGIYIVSAKGLSNQPIRYYRLGHKCTLFYTNWPTHTYIMLVIEAFQIHQHLISPWDIITFERPYWQPLLYHITPKFVLSLLCKSLPQQDLFVSICFTTCMHPRFLCPLFPNLFLVLKI